MQMRDICGQSFIFLPSLRVLQLEGEKESLGGLKESLRERLASPFCLLLLRQVAFFFFASYSHPTVHCGEDLNKHFDLIERFF